MGIARSTPVSVRLEGTLEAFRYGSSSWASSIRILWPGSKRQPLPCSSIGDRAGRARRRRVRAAVDQHRRAVREDVVEARVQLHALAPVEARDSRPSPWSRRSSSPAWRSGSLVVDGDARARPAGVSTGQRPPLTTTLATGSACAACGFGSTSLVVVCVPVDVDSQACRARAATKLRRGEASARARPPGLGRPAFCGQICSAAVTSNVRLRLGWGCRAAARSGR